MDSDGDSGSDAFLYTDEEDNEESFNKDLQRVKENSPLATRLVGDGEYDYFQDMDDSGWEELGSYISSNSHLQELHLCGDTLNDQTIVSLFRGLTSSNTIEEIYFRDNGLSTAGVRSMVPFLHNANNLNTLDLDGNTFASDGFNILFSALRNSPIEYLYCNDCGIESIEIDNNHIPKHLAYIGLNDNSINTDGCRGLATLLQREGATLMCLWLSSSKINDDGVEVLVDALQSNTSLKTLNLMWNNGISDQGKISLLKLVIDISSIKATLQSNHTLECLNVNYTYSHEIQPDDEIEQHIDMAIQINKFYPLFNPEAIGRKKVIKSHLHSETRARLCRLQGVNRSHYSEIDPLYIPEVLALINQNHDRSELYVALKSSIMILFSTVNRKKCIQQQREYHVAHIAELRAKVEELDAELAAIEASEGDVVNVGSESRSSKRRRA